MNNTFSKTLLAGSAIFFLFTLCACSYVNELESQQPVSPSERLSEESSIILRIPAFKYTNIANVASIDLYQFSDGAFVKKLSVDPSIDNDVEFARKPGTRIYALAGYDMGGIQKLTESDFSTMTIPVPKDAYSAPIFFSSVSELSYFTENAYIELLTGVARLDIDNEDPDLKIENVSIAGAASSSQIFPTEGRTYGTTSASYSRTYEDGIKGIAERAFILFETSSPITVTVSGRRNGKAVEIVSHTPAIARNTIYTVCIDEEKGGDKNKERLYSSDGNSDEEGHPGACIRVRDWEEGDVERASIYHEESAIDLERSVIPPGVRINSADNTVTVPADGVSGMKLAFMTRSPLNLGSVLSDTEGISITPLSPTATEDGYISQFRVDIAKQPKGATRYNATVFFNGSSSFFLNVEVEPSPYQIPTVHIGGHDWMCFNAVSQDPEEQIYLQKGLGVEEMYREHFKDYIGNMFQYGRPNPFSPWKAYDPNMSAGQKRDKPWETKSMMPLPKGYHIPSAAEWEDLIPSGTVIPSNYRTRTGDSIRVTIAATSGTLDNTSSAATNAQKYLKRGVLFESITTGARLFFPMAGMKTNASAEIPTHPDYRFDTRSGYWMKEEHQAMDLKCEKTGDGTERIQLKRHNWNPDGLLMIRGIKD